MAAPGYRHQPGAASGNGVDVINWRGFVQRKHLDREIARDLEFYIEAETDDNVARGMPRLEARAAALRKLGNPAQIREEVYRMNTAGLIESVWQDLRYAFRVLRQSPAFTAAAVVSLALGIGGNTAVFTVVRGVLLKPLPYAHPDRLVKVAERDGDSPFPETVDFTTTDDLRNRSRSFESLSLYRDASGAIVENGQPELLDGMRVNSSYFDTLGIKAQWGRTFLPEEDQPARRFEMILTHGLWMRRFGGDPRVLGRTVRLSDASFTIVGVLPPEFQPLSQTDRSTRPEWYMPLGYALNQPSACRGCQHLQLIGLLKPGVSAEQARQELNAIMRDIVREHPKDYAQSEGVAVTPLQQHLVNRVQTAMWVLLGAVSFVLLIACANVANLMLARATGRSKEMALRAALGAGRLRLVRQLILESLLLTIASGAAGLLLAMAATSALVAYGSKELPRMSEIRIDATVLWFTLAASLLTVALSGTIPAWRASRVDLTDSLRSVGWSGEGRSRHRLRSVLVAAELALAFLLVVDAGLLAKSFLRLTGVNPGYDPHNVLTLGVYVYGQRYQNPQTELNYYRQVIERLHAIPGVESAGMVSTLPLGSFDRRSFHIQDRHLANDSEAPAADAYSASPDYFRVLRIPLKRGRFFNDADRQGAPLVALISESCARSQFPHQDPIGKHIQLGGRHDDREWLTIVGVVGDVRQHSFDRPSNMEAYMAQAQDLSFAYNMVVRTATDPRRFQKAIRNAFLAVDATQPVYRVRPFEDYVSDSLAARTFTLALLGLFGALALALAAIGVYGVIAYTVSLRTREVGIRMALGAGRREVLSMVLRQGFALVAAGLAAGLCASIALTRFLSILLYEVKPGDSTTAAAAALTLATVALFAAYLPARRATRIDPIVALRVG